MTNGDMIRNMNDVDLAETLAGISNIRNIGMNPIKDDHLSLIRDWLSSEVEPCFHEFKILPVFFEAVIAGRKRFELREDDRHLGVGDIFTLREYNPKHGYTGRLYRGNISYVLRNCPEYGLMEGYVIFGW